MKNTTFIPNSFQIIIFIFASNFLFTSCKSGNEKTLKTSKSTISKNISNSAIKDVQFDCMVIKNPTEKHLLEIRAVLINNSEDTIYFLSTNCEGAQYSLKFDTTKLLLMPSLICNQSKPIILKIEPYNQYQFSTIIKNKNNVNNFKIGFDLYAVDQEFIIYHNKNINIFNRPDSEQSIVWSNEIQIN